MTDHNKMSVAVVGGGRMGLPLACVFADRGARVTVCDVNDELVESLNRGACPYEEPGLEEMLHQVVDAGRLTATTNTTGAVSRSQTVVVIVPAHLTPEQDIDYSILKSASADIGRGLQPGTLISYETTVSVGGTRHELVPVLETESGLKAGETFSVAFSPERVKANLVFARLRENVKVIGGFDGASRRKAVAFYSEYLGAPVKDVESLEAAEFTKLAGMLYRDVNIALVNELAAFSETLGIDFDVVREAANQDGEASLLVPGIGVGGHCTPVYPYFITKPARASGAIQHLGEAARIINQHQPARYVERLQQYWSDLRGKTVHIMGLSFRPGVKVHTLSPAYDLKEALEEHGASVTIEDPYYTREELVRERFTPARVGHDPVDAVILNTAHPQFASPPFDQWAARGVRAVVDGRNQWNGAAAERAGLIYMRVGAAVRGPLREEHGSEAVSASEPE